LTKQTQSEVTNEALKQAIQLCDFEARMFLRDGCREFRAVRSAQDAVLQRARP
jgi:hypothetical protein